MKKLLFLILLLVMACVKTDDFEMPEIDEVKVVMPEGQITDVAAVKNNYDADNNEIYTFEDTETYMEAYVVSSDEGGNFYKELVVQDKPENPNAGLLILVDDSSLFETFNFGRKIFVKLDGLSLWENNGVIQLGKQNRGDVAGIPNALIDEHLIRTAETLGIIPLPLEISEFSEEYENLYVKLNNVQFNRNLVGEERRFTFAGEQIDEFDGERQLESCQTGASTTLLSSVYSDFKSLLLPRGSGSLEGVLTRNFYDDYFVLAINTVEAIDFQNERCDPDFLKCGGDISAGNEVLFEENFTTITSQANLESGGWMNINVNGGETRFEPGTFDGDRYIRISAFNTEENPLETWLVSPPVDLSEHSSVVVSFETMASYDNATILEFFISEDFTGNPKTANWLPLEANIPVGPTNQYGLRYEYSAIDISCLESEIFLGFRYLGAAPDKTTTYDIDNVRVTGNR